MYISVQLFYIFVVGDVVSIFFHGCTNMVHFCHRCSTNCSCGECRYFTAECYRGRDLFTVRCVRAELFRNINLSYNLACFSYRGVSVLCTVMAKGSGITVRLLLVFSSWRSFARSHLPQCWLECSLVHMRVKAYFHYDCALRFVAIESWFLRSWKVMKF